MKPVRKKTKSYEDLRAQLKLKSLDAQKRFKEKYHLADEILRKKEIDLGKIREHSAKLLGTGALTGTLLLAPPSGAKSLPFPHEVVQIASDIPQKDIKTNAQYLQEILQTLPTPTRPLSRNEEKYLEQVIFDTFAVKAKATLEGEHLNTSYGMIGAEQHLKRFPGDSLSFHAPKEGEYGGENPSEILKEGIAPGLGAWGYFAPSRTELTPELEETERWYAVVQTLYLPDWGRRQPYLRDWYKYRKVIIINKDNGKAVVASIADAGPAAWTGKHYGGSPEVMDYLGGPRYKKGPVVVMFVDDPNNTVPLGPVGYNRKELKI